MNTINVLFDFLVSVAVISFIVLGVGAFLTRWLSQPIERLRSIQWTFAGLVIALLVRHGGLLPELTLHVLPSESVAATSPTLAIQPDVGPQLEHATALPAPAMLADTDSILEPPAPVGLESDALPASAAAAASSTGERVEPFRDWSSTAWAALRIAVVIIATCGAFYSLITLLVARWQLRRLVSRCRAAHSSVTEDWPYRSQADAMGVQVMVSSEESVPLAFGIRRPVIVLPESMLVSAGLARSPRDLRNQQQAIGYCLSHEFAHIRSRDVLTWSLFHCLQPLLWFQPMFWHLRREMRMAQDQLADNFAAGKGEDPTAYAELLVRFARQRIHAGGGLALTMADRRSSLYRRVERLLSGRLSTARSARRKVLVATVACFTILATTLGTLRIEPAEAAASPTPLVTPLPDEESNPADKKEGESKKPKDNAKDAVELSYSGKVVDKTTNEPIAGAKVVVRRSILLSHDRRMLEESEHQTDKDGVYRFVIPPEQTAERGLYIELDVEHPDYAWKKGFGYALSMIRKNEKLGEAPFFAHIDLQPAEALTGRVVDPNGKPIAGALIQAYSKSSEEDFRDYGSFFKTQSDDDGKFRLQLIKGGPSVFWIIPQNYSPMQIVSGSKRGDWGDIKVKEGVAIHGQVINATGQPVAGVWVNLEDQSVRSEVGLPVATYVNRSAQTNQDGRFQLRPMVPGTYHINVEEYGSEVTAEKRQWSQREPLEDVFVSHQIEIGPQDADKPFTVQAIPHVEFHAQYLNSKGQPRSGHAVTIFGRLDGQFFHTRCAPDKKGKIFGKLPHGLSEVRMDAITNEHSAIQVRLEKDGPLMGGRRVDLGTVENDITGIEIIRYTAPIVQVKPVDENGDVIKDCKVSAVYVDGKDETMTPVGGMATNVFFEHQKDGRHRTSQLIPDRDTKFTVRADGYSDVSEVIQLPEGEEKELLLVLKKAPEADTSEEPEATDSKATDSEAE